MDKESKQYKSLSKVQKAYYDGYDDGWAEALLNAPENTIHNSEYTQCENCINYPVDFDPQCVGCNNYSKWKQ